MFYGCDRYPECKFASWDRPVPGPCPDCGASILVDKITKRAGHIRRCRNKECGYSMQVLDTPQENGQPAAPTN
jgi:DNA topoisomerase I